MKKNIISLLTFLLIVLFAKAQKGWEITTQTKKDYVPACVANGQIGIVPDSIPFQTQNVILNHVFDRQSPNDISKVLCGINPFNINIKVNNNTIALNNINQWKQTLNMKVAALNCSFDYSDQVHIEYSIQALRNLPFCGLMEVTIQAKNDVTLDITNLIKTPAQYQNVQTRFLVLKDLEVRMPILRTIAESPFGAHQLSTASGFIFNEDYPDFKENTENPYQSTLSFTQSLKKGGSFTFNLIGSICNSQDFNDPIGESERFVIFAQLAGREKLLKEHQKEWEQLWESDIVIDGDHQSQIDIRFALFNLYSFIRADNNLSIPPMGLSSQGYNGHVFWDSEIWMYPPLVVLHPGLGRSMMNYRIDRLEKAIERARNYGYKGAMFPWESDYSGEEATPTWCLTGVLEQHITADIGIAVWNYYCLTKDFDWLLSKGWPILKNVADFWTSRATKNPDGSFSIENIVGADEWAHIVTNNAFTNGSVKTALDNAVKAAIVLKQEINRDWIELRDHICIEKFNNGITREHSEYQGETIKQADVNLLAYPLQIITDKESILKNLQFYESRLSSDGPAMSYSIFSILYARLGNAEKAFEMFRKAYIPNKRAPFGVLAESATSDNPYFATGAGGMLQAVIFGFAGLEISENGISQGTPCLPKGWNSLTLTGIGPKKETFTIGK